MFIGAESNGETSDWADRGDWFWRLLPWALFAGYVFWQNGGAAL
jgi:hypothetical protein